MRWRLPLLVALFVAGPSACRAVPTAGDFDFPDADAIEATEDVPLGTDGGDAGDGVATPDLAVAADAADIADAPDADQAEVEDSVDASEDVLDGADVAATPDADVGSPDGSDAASEDAPDSALLADVEDVADVPDVAEVPDAPDVAKAEVEETLDVSEDAFDGADVAVTPDADVESPDGSDAASEDAPDSALLADVADVPDVPDVAEVPDAPDVAQAEVEDTVDASEDVLDGADASATPDADVGSPDGSDAASEDAPDSALLADVDSGADGWSDSAEGPDVPTAADAPDASDVPDTAADPCLTLNCDDGNACTTDDCASGACQHVDLPDWSTCGEGLVCDGAGVCQDVKTAKGMAYIPAGTFWMGCNATKDSSCSADESPQHKVTLSAYYMDLTETTVTQYKACVDAGGCTVPSTQSPSTYAAYPGFPNNPVNFVDWAQSQAYCKWRGAAFDLPTEAQWEMAARGSCEMNGSTAGEVGCATAMRTYPWGEATPTCSYAVMAVGGCGTNATWAVGSKPAGDSPYGLHDMAGNVFEWNRDRHSGTYYKTSPNKDPENSASGSSRVYRGGRFDTAGITQRSGFRTYGDPPDADYGVGLRCIRSFTTPDLCTNVTCPTIACATNTCDPATGQCVATPTPDTTPCDDGNACTTSDVCTAGTCAGTVNCDDGNACTADSCDGTNTCQHVDLPEWTTCGEGLVCDGAGVCQDVKTAKGMAYIPAGTFWMGCNGTKDTSCSVLGNENPQHKVTLSAYYIDLTETTVTQYKACVDAGGCTVPSTLSPLTYATYPGFPNNPVNFVNWTQSQAYCKWRGDEFDLPTEAQWEMAARGSCEKNGSTAGDAGCAAAMRTYPWGDAVATCSYAVMHDGTNSGCGTKATWAVGSKTAGNSPYGLNDMAGNVFEWTRDLYGETYYSEAPSHDPLNSSGGSNRVLRGGSFVNVTTELRASDRSSYGPSVGYVYLGFRCSRSSAPPDLCANVTCPTIACSTNTCDPATGQCVATPAPDTTPCDDGNACTTSDVCTGGTCKGSDPACGNGSCECGESNLTCLADCPSTPPAGMVMIPAGTFWMGCNATKDSTCSSNANESPQHKVTLSAYYMDLTEITVSQWQACVNASGCTVPSTQSPSPYATYPDFANNPVNYISWTQAQAYCKWRGAEYDLPTEAQWEMAARGSCEQNGSTAGDPGCAAAMRTYPWGETAPSASYAVYGVSSTAAVGSKTAGDSPYGLHDMAGNVWEWTRDWYSGTYYGISPSIDPVNSASASDRVYRGGSYFDAAVYVRAGFRIFSDPSGVAFSIGLRCMRSYP